MMHNEGKEGVVTVFSNWYTQQEKDIYYVERLSCTCKICSVLIHTTKPANVLILKLYVFTLVLVLVLFCEIFFITAQTRITFCLFNVLTMCLQK